MRVNDILTESRTRKGPITKRLLLHEVSSGEVVVKLDLQLYDNYTWQEMMSSVLHRLPISVEFKLKFKKLFQIEKTVAEQSFRIFFKLGNLPASSKLMSEILSLFKKNMDTCIFTINCKFFLQMKYWNELYNFSKKKNNKVLTEFGEKW